MSSPEVIASPSVRRLARERGVDLESLARRLGRTTLGREDVLGPSAPPPATAARSPWDADHAAHGPVTREPLPRLARVAAPNLVASHTNIPSVTHHDSAEVGRVERLRAELAAEGRRVTALAFHVAVLARCLREFPRFNASLDPDGATLVLKGYVHVGLAVDTGAGLAVPVIRDADRLGLLALAAAITDLGARARAQRLRPHEMGGASMTISNLGALGGEAFTPIINPPEVAILGLGRTAVRPHWDGAAFVPCEVVPLDLTYDHRVLDGADAARFVGRYRALLADPDRMLVAGRP